MVFSKSGACIVGGMLLHTTMPLWIKKLLGKYVGRKVLQGHNLLVFGTLLRFVLRMFQKHCLPKSQAKVSGFLGKSLFSHAIVVPVCAETFQDIYATLRSITCQKNSKSSLYLILALEECSDSSIIAQVQKEFGKDFKRVDAFIHPSGISPNIETPGCGANVNWAIRQFVAKLDQEKVDYSKMIYTKVDSQIRLGPGYINEIENVFADDPRAIAQPIVFYNTNQVEPSLQALSDMRSAFYQFCMVPDSVICITTYSLMLENLKNAGFYDPKFMSEDNNVFLRQSDYQGLAPKLHMLRTPVFNTSPETMGEFIRQDLRWSTCLVEYLRHWWVQGPSARKFMHLMKLYWVRIFMAILLPFYVPSLAYHVFTSSEKQGRKQFTSILALLVTFTTGSCYCEHSNNTWLENFKQNNKAVAVSVACGMYAYVISLVNKTTVTIPRRRKLQDNRSSTPKPTKVKFATAPNQAPREGTTIPKYANIPASEKSRIPYKTCLRQSLEPLKV
uniref:Glycosyltransferase 2-like domain-containing protein n=1 Tax=Mucochytrium quahogii TaxID=96639 RepID=A0A7S2WCU5_9STRA|mmetsp:Transcript_19986/g.43088  ORF Transcript_19986/g.43088 Transcript_19986/m.43088 type:complete len:501 (+) Transcript_19986:27-1529(+)